jgi:hypothetical protein
MTKGVRGASEEFEYGMGWVTARRSFLSVFQDRLECGDWHIPYHTITQAVLFKTRQMFIPCYILKIRTEESAYQFGLNGNKFWATELPFPVAREKGRLKYSKFSIAVRVILVAALIWYFFFRS